MIHENVEKYGFFLHQNHKIRFIVLCDYQLETCPKVFSSLPLCRYNQVFGKP